MPQTKTRTVAATRTAPIVSIYGGEKGERQSLGAERYEVEWEELTKAAEARYTTDEHYEHDRDRDEVTLVAHFQAKVLALAAARRIVKGKRHGRPRTVYGCARVILQRVELIEDYPYNVGEWLDVDDAEYVE